MWEPFRTKTNFKVNLVKDDGHAEDVVDGRNTFLIYDPCFVFFLQFELSTLLFFPFFISFYSSSVFFLIVLYHSFIFLLSLISFV